MQKDHMWGENVCILDDHDYRIIYVTTIQGPGWDFRTVGADFQNCSKKLKVKATLLSK